MLCLLLLCVHVLVLRLRVLDLVQLCGHVVCVVELLCRGRHCVACDV